MGRGRWSQTGAGEYFFLFFWLHCGLSSPTRGQGRTPIVKALNHNPGPQGNPQDFFSKGQELH